MTSVTDKRIHAAFEIGVVLKGVNGLAELAGGVILFFTSVDAIRTIVTWLVHSELIEDPHDRVASYLMHAAQGVSVGGKAFAAFYLVSHGVVKLILVAGLLRSRPWGLSRFAGGARPLHRLPALSPCRSPSRSASAC